MAARQSPPLEPSPAPRMTPFPMPSNSSEPTGFRRIALLFARGLNQRCPVCGGGHLFSSWFSMARRCPRCGFALDREEGYVSGAMAVNLISTELILATIVLAAIVLYWPTPPWQWIWYTSVPSAVILPLATYPVSRTLWVAFDLVFRPPTPADFQTSIPRIR